MAQDHSIRQVLITGNGLVKAHHESETLAPFLILEALSDLRGMPKLNVYPKICWLSSRVTEF